MEDRNHSEQISPRLYSDLADWWHLLSAPGDYDEEAGFIARTLYSACRPKTLLELGSGGGNNAFHLKEHFQLTLVDSSAGMLAASQQLNPTCEHILADMRTLRLDRQFDAVLIHDAIVYMTNRLDLQRAILTAAWHCRTGGAVLLLPDSTCESFSPITEHGGEDDSERGVRYLSWTYDPDPTDDQYVMDFAYLLRSAGGSLECIHDRHTCGLFTKETWLETMRQCGLAHQAIEDDFGRVVFLGMKSV